MALKGRAVCMTRTTMWLACAGLRSPCLVDVHKPLLTLGRIPRVCTDVYPLDNEKGFLNYILRLLRYITLLGHAKHPNTGRIE